MITKLLFSKLLYRYCFQANPLKSDTLIVVPVSFCRWPSDTNQSLIDVYLQAIDLNRAKRYVLLARQNIMRLETCLIMLI